MTKEALMGSTTPFSAPPCAPPLPDALLVTKEAAAYLRTSERAMENWRITGAGPVWVRVGPRRVVYRASDLAAWVEANMHASRAAEMQGKAA